MSRSVLSLLGCLVCSQVALSEFALLHRQRDTYLGPITLGAPPSSLALPGPPDSPVLDFWSTRWLVINHCPLFPASARPFPSTSLIFPRCSMLQRETPGCLFWLCHRFISCVYAYCFILVVVILCAAFDTSQRGDHKEGCNKRSFNRYDVIDKTVVILSLLLFINLFGNFFSAS